MYFLRDIFGRQKKKKKKLRKSCCLTISYFLRAFFGSSWEFILKKLGHDIFEKLNCLRNIYLADQKKIILFFKEIVLFDGFLFFKRFS